MKLVDLIGYFAHLTGEWLDLLGYLVYLLRNGAQVLLKLDDIFLEGGDLSAEAFQIIQPGL